MSGGPGSLAEPLNEQAFGQGVVSMGKHFFYVRNLSKRYHVNKIIKMLKNILSVLGHTSDDIYPEELAQSINLDSWIFFASPNGVNFEWYRSNHVMEVCSYILNIIISIFFYFDSLFLVFRLEQHTAKKCSHSHFGTMGSVTVTAEIRKLHWS